MSAAKAGKPIGERMGYQVFVPRETLTDRTALDALLRYALEQMTTDPELRPRGNWEVVQTTVSIRWSAYAPGTLDDFGNVAIMSQSAPWDPDTAELPEWAKGATLWLGAQVVRRG